MMPFSPTGSFNYRNGFFKGRTKEQRFEQFVNAIQARHDELSHLNEWRRLKDLEENAILLYHQLGGNLKEYARQMATRDQNETELQQQRNNQKRINLDPKLALTELHRMEQTRLQNLLRVHEAEARAKFRARVQASSDPVVSMKTITNAAGSQQASQQSELTRSKPEKTGKSLGPISSAEVGPPRQQEQKARPSPEEIRRQFQAQVRSLPNVSSNVRSVPARTAASTREVRAETPGAALPVARKSPFGAELAGYQPRMGITHGVQYPKGSVLRGSGLGLAKLHLGGPSEAEQRTVKEHPAIGSREQSTSPCSRQTSSEESTPPTSGSSSPAKIPLVRFPPPATKHTKLQAKSPANLNQKEEIDNSERLRELEREQFGHVRSGNRWEKLKAATRSNPFLHSLIGEHVEREKMKKEAMRRRVEE